MKSISSFEPSDADMDFCGSAGAISRCDALAESFGAPNH
jgi:hypothetical protein